jgi:hypothetical protein
MKTCIFLAALLSAASSFAQIAIDQNRALAGGITAGDTPGYPITINQPGSYKLTGNLTVPADEFGILILAENVTLDLNGYTVRGPMNCTRTVSTKEVSCPYYNVNAVGILATQKDAVVRNGMVRGFASNGVWLQQSGTVDEVHASHNAGYGVSVDRGHVHDVHVEMNGDGGINVSAGLVSRSVARNNANHGIRASYIQESLSTGNRKYGIQGRVRATASLENGMGDFYPGSSSMGGNIATNGAY